jgi:hypothetical protein
VFQLASGGRVLGGRVFQLACEEGCWGEGCCSLLWAEECWEEGCCSWRSGTLSGKSVGKKGVASKGVGR